MVVVAAESVKRVHEGDCGAGSSGDVGTSVAVEHLLGRFGELEAEQGTRCSLHS